MKTTQWPAIFIELAAPRYFRKRVTFDGRVVKNVTTLLSGAVFGNHWTATACIFGGRVVKNRGSRNSSALPDLLAEMGRPPQLGATHPRAGGQDYGSKTNSLKRTVEVSLATRAPNESPEALWKSF